MKKRIISLVIAVVLCFAMIVPASVSADDLAYLEKVMTADGDTITLTVTLRGPKSVCGGQVDIYYPADKLEYVNPGLNEDGLEDYSGNAWIGVTNGNINGHTKAGEFKTNFFGASSFAPDQIVCVVKFKIVNGPVSAADFTYKDLMSKADGTEIQNPTDIKYTCNHKYAVDTEASVAATCATAGKTVEKCSTCGETKETTVPATGKHTYAVTATTAATCTAEGSEVSTCSVCGDEQTKTIAKLPHDYIVNTEESKANTCTEDGVEVSYCSVCNDKQEVVLKAAHKFDEGKITKEATETEEGEMTYTCDVCDEVEVVAIPKLEVKDDATTGTDKDTGKDADKDATDNAQNGATNATGDSAMILLVSFIAVISLAVIATIVYRNKVRN